MPIKNCPEDISDGALGGFAGKVVKAYSELYEGRKVIILVHFIAFFIMMVGSAVSFNVGELSIPLNQYFCICGFSASSSKGTALRLMEGLYRAAFSEKFDKQILRGLSSAEGIAAEVAQASGEGEKVSRLIIEEEFGRILRLIQRQGSVLSTALRELYDGSLFNFLTKNNPLKLIAYICVVTHITEVELLSLIKTDDIYSGFLNRFMIFWTKSEKLISRPKPLDPMVKKAIIEELREIVEYSLTIKKIKWSLEAEELWDNIYHIIHNEEYTTGVSGALLARASSSISRLSATYALLDKKDTIERAHLENAYSLWLCSADSTKYLFDGCSKNTLSDSILRVLVDCGGSLTKTEIRECLDHNISVSKFNKSLQNLIKNKRIACERVKTKGRAATVFRFLV
jgi:hypothetical protein